MLNKINDAPNNISWRRAKILRLILVGFSVIALIVAAVLCWNWLTGEGSVDVFKSFVRAVAVGDETTARNYLTLDTRTAVDAFCPDGSVIACFDKYGRESWGDARGFIFIQARPNPDGSEYHIYEVVWTKINDSTGFKITTVRENGHWRVDSWQINEGELFPPTSTASTRQLVTPVLVEIETTQPTQPPPPIRIGLNALESANDFFFASFDQDCRLPCWEDLQVGKATWSEVQNKIAAIFGEESAVINSGQVKESLTLYTYAWRVEQGAGLERYLYISFAIDNHTQRWLASGFSFYDTTFSQYVNPNIFIEKMGTPDEIYIDTTVGERDTYVSLSFVYQPGVLIRFSSSVPSNVSPLDGSTPVLPRYCFGEALLTVDAGTESEITLAEDLEDPRLVQSIPEIKRLDNWVTDPATQSIEKVLGISEDELARTLEADPNHCFTIPIRD